jgi:purine-nucleoside phosphorylase
MSFHINAKDGQIADAVLLPGDPLRAKFVAENFLSDVICYNQIRGMLGYTGFYNGKKISVQGTGMGMPSLSIYLNELIRDYGAKTLLRIGSCGAIKEDLPLGRVLLATSASGDSGANKSIFQGLDFAPTPDFELLFNAVVKAKELGVTVLPAPIFSTDSFYDYEENRWDVWKKHGVVAVEMESQMLYTIAARYSVKALSLLTISDNIENGQSLSAEERESSFTDMISLALEVATK